MLLTISSTANKASELGYLLHKHPDKLQTVDLSVGKAHIFYPESSDSKTTVALLLDIDPIDLVRGKRNFSGKGFALGQYVNDRPYVASSFMSVALSKAFSTAMNGQCNKRPDLLNKAIPLEVKISVLPAPKGGERLIRNLFEPLGYSVNLERHELDEHFPKWGDSKYYTLELKHHLLLKDLLSHLYVLIPALDNDKHYFISKNEVEKLLEKGGKWLQQHPAKELIVQRYLINLRSLTRSALEQLEEGDANEQITIQKEKRESLHQLRIRTVFDKIVETGAKSVLDLGCGEGKLMRLFIKNKQFEKISGMDVSYSSLVKCKERLHWEEMSPKQKERIDLFQGALTYRDKRLDGFDAAAIVEVIEHLDLDRLRSFERVVFEFAKPKTVVITTPNAEYNVLYENLEAETMRHSDHRFEWTRKEFKDWASAVAQRNNYSVQILPIGEEDKNHGAPSQMAIFKDAN